MQGWIPKVPGRTGAIPMPTAYFTQRGGPVHFLYVFAPAAPGKPIPITAVKSANVEGATLAADIVFADGATHRFVLQQNGVSLTQGAKTLRVEVPSTAS
jgi:hypothetical protein